MAELHDDLTSISDEVQRATKLPPASMLRERGDRRRRRRASVTGAALVVLVVATGTALLRTRETAPDPADSLAPSAVASAAASAGPEEILAGRRQIAIVVPSMGGAVLALGRDDDRVRATTEQGADERAQWVLRPEGNLFRIVLATSRGQVCMTAVHDAAPGSVRGLACAPSAQAQLFRVDREADGSWSLFQGKRYVQVVDGTDALVPDLPEYLTTTYEFQDRGPTAD
ncbi:hypothetical protein [Catellatospora citrea]|uniref:Uncharacterized protein n=1 Tax=Catellatospora citrea TaxID=53366 RepID=A0A8J3KJP8_9ACTN|nr:hypothetical protein [Catellatospora citrea]RKE08082.1 hypothetical protein C8E86_2925 [Catellatospora citrea]GIF98463.1 hypothetical protein Cci01nite_35570 [Catellatospora citrea]